MIHWLPDDDERSLTSDEGYRIHWQPMGRACWCNAYSPRGAVLASGRLSRCLEACEKHLAGETRGKGKRQFRDLHHRGRKVADAPTSYGTRSALTACRTAEQRLADQYNVQLSAG